MALLAPSPRAICVREAATAAAPPPHSPAACSTVGGEAAGRALWVWNGGGRGRTRERWERVRAEAYFWDVSKPVEMEEIDSMEKLDEALRWSVENNQAIIIDWYDYWHHNLFFSRFESLRYCLLLPGWLVGVGNAFT